MNLRARSYRPVSNKKKSATRLEFPGSGVSIPFPDDDDPEAEARAVSDAYQRDPVFRAMVDESKRNRADRKGIPAEHLYRELGYTPPDRAQRNGPATPGRGKNRRRPQTTGRS
jgi:hypothetical protein